MGSVRDIAHSFCEIAHARLLALQAADKMDRDGNKTASDLIAAAKDRGARHGRASLTAPSRFTAPPASPRTPSSRAYVYARFIRIGDGPDQVHLGSSGEGADQARRVIG